LCRKSTHPSETQRHSVLPSIFDKQGNKLSKITQLQPTTVFELATGHATPVNDDPALANFQISISEVEPEASLVFCLLKISIYPKSEKNHT
jgi:hypothetical protein